MLLIVLVCVCVCACVCMLRYGTRRALSAGNVA